MWEMSNHKTAGNLMSVEGKRCPSVQPPALSLANVQSLGPAGRGPRNKILPTDRDSDLLSGSVQQIEEGGCALCLQLKMKRDNISRVENYRT